MRKILFVLGLFAALAVMAQEPPIIGSKPHKANPSDTALFLVQDGSVWRQYRVSYLDLQKSLATKSFDSLIIAGVKVSATATELNYDAIANRTTSPTRLVAITTTIQVVNTNGTVFTLAGPGFAGRVEKIVIAPGATLPADAGGVTLAITKTGGTLVTSASTVDLTSGGETASTAHAEALNSTTANRNLTSSNVLVATLATDGTVTTAGSPILVTVWYSLDNN